MPGRMLKSWCTLHRPDVLGCLWMAVLLGSLTWLDFRDGGIFLISPFAATLTILIYQPNVSIAQPIAVVGGSPLGAAIGTVLSALIGFGPGVALLAALTAMIMLPLLRVFHPPGVALAMCPALLHCRASILSNLIATLRLRAPHRVEISIPPPTSIFPFAGFAPTPPRSRICRICPRRARRPAPGWCVAVAIVRKL